MNARPDSLSGADTGGPGLKVVTLAVNALLERRGLTRVVTEGSPEQVLHSIGDRLPSSFRWCVVESPRDAATVWSALCEGEVPHSEEPGPGLRETLWRRSQAGVHTVLGVAETPTVPDEIFGLLDELAGMEPMLQIVLVSGTSPRRDSEPARRLAMRIRQEFTASVPPATIPASPEPTPATRSIDAYAAAGPATHPTWSSSPRLEAAGQRTFDPFRNRFIAPSIDTPRLLPVLSDPHGLHSEWFRVLRLRLEDWVRSRGGTPQAIAITGPEAAVGKTFIAVNLALLWANSTFERVLLIDGDLRRPEYHSLFEIRQRPGLADVLARRCRPEDCTTYVSEVGLHVMPAGRAGNPRQLVNPDRVERVIASLKSAYDLVILDGPPLVGLADGPSYAAGCDGALMVVRAGRTRMRTLKRALEELPRDRLIGTVVNDAGDGLDGAYAQYRNATRR